MQKPPDRVCEVANHKDMVQGSPSCTPDHEWCGSCGACYTCHAEQMPVTQLYDHPISVPTWLRPDEPKYGQD